MAPRAGAWREVGERHGIPRLARSRRLLARFDPSPLFLFSPRPAPNHRVSTVGSRHAVGPSLTRGILWEDDGNEGSARDAVNVYEFERTFGPASTQRDVYAHVQPVVRGALQGYNGVVFAYGQTGSGKTYTMQGPAEAPGVIPHALTEVFQTAARAAREGGRAYEFALSYVELYNEDLLDLLGNEEDPEGEGGSQPLLVREDAERGVYIQGVTETPVSCYADAARALAAGEERRHVAATQLNRYSSRSHTLLRLVITSRPIDPDGLDGELTGGADGGGGVLRSELLLVDLAGSERAKRRGKYYETRFAEGRHINMSLLALGRVIRQLAAGGVTNPGQSDETHAQHVPFRDSRLTRLLEPALGGGARTAVIACLSPAAEFAEDSRSTLRFAERCTLVQNHARLNHHEQGVQLREALRRAQAEADELRRQLNALALAGGAGGGDAAAAAAAALAREGQMLRARLARAQAENASLRANHERQAGQLAGSSGQPLGSDPEPAVGTEDASRAPSVVHAAWSNLGGNERRGASPPRPGDRLAAPSDAAPHAPGTASGAHPPGWLDASGAAAVEAMIQRLTRERDAAVADARAARSAAAAARSGGPGGGGGGDSEVEDALMAECARLRGEVARARAEASRARQEAAAVATDGPAEKGEGEGLAELERLRAALDESTRDADEQRAAAIAARAEAADARRRLAASSTSAERPSVSGVDDAAPGACAAPLAPRISNSSTSLDHFAAAEAAAEAASASDLEAARERARADALELEVAKLREALDQQYDRTVGAAAHLAAAADEYDFAAYEMPASLIPDDERRAPVHAAATVHEPTSPPPVEAEASSRPKSAVAQELDDLEKELEFLAGGVTADEIEGLFGGDGGGGGLGATYNPFDDYDGSVADPDEYDDPEGVTKAARGGKQAASAVASKGGKRDALSELGINF